MEARNELADNLSNRGPADRSRINVNEPWERTYWSKEPGCTEQQLRDAVKAVGGMADAVRRHLSVGSPENPAENDARHSDRAPDVAVPKPVELVIIMSSSSAGSTDVHLEDS